MSRPDISAHGPVPTSAHLSSLDLVHLVLHATQLTLSHTDNFPSVRNLARSPTMLSARYPQATRLATAACRARGRQSYATEGVPRPKSAHASLYSDTFPAMIPVFLLGSAVYLVRACALLDFCYMRTCLTEIFKSQGLQLTQLNLSHEKHMEEAMERVQILEAEVDALQKQRASQLQSSTVDTSSPSTPPQHNKTSRWRWW
jgi:hypothetical protein